jgi:two-component system CheB/CheR fusion protein
VERAVAAELDRRRAMQTVADAAQELTRVELVALLLAANGTTREDAGPYVTSESRPGPLLEWLSRHHDEIVTSVVSAGQPLLLGDLDLPPEDGEGPLVEALVGVPIRSRLGGSRGALVLIDDCEDRLGVAEEEIAVSLAAQAAIALDNAQLYHEERRARSAAQSASEAKDRFMNMLSHELRNPLGSIRSAIEALSLKDTGGADERRMRSIIVRQVGHLGRMADELLDASRIERGKVTLERRPLDLVAEVGEVLEAFAPRIRDAGLELRPELPIERLWVDGDPTRLAQVVGNLLSNAVKFTPSGGWIRVRMSRVGDEAVLSVRDSGPGVRAQDVSLLFEPFVQSEATAGVGLGGLGLGLAIVRGLVAAHGGEVEVLSEGPGTGADFVVRLPLRAAPQAEDDPVVDETGGARRRILVIDDHLDSAEGLAELLRIEGHSVEVAGDGHSGLEVADRLEPQLVICDLGLPGVDGYAVAQELRSRPELRHAEIVALSGFGDDAAVERARDAGFDDHLTKPIDPQVLRRLAAGLRRLRFRSAPVRSA